MHADILNRIVRERLIKRIFKQKVFKQKKKREQAMQIFEENVQAEEMQLKEF